MGFFTGCPQRPDRGSSGDGGQRGGIASLSPSAKNGPATARERRMERCTFRRKDRLVRAADFKALKAAGTRVSTPHFVVMARPSPAGRSRLGITAGTSIGKATQRNRVKRLLREFFRSHKHALPAPTDMG